MSRRLKLSITWLWISTLLSATVGVSVHQLYCYCRGITTYSVFHEPADRCESGPKKTRHACCKKRQRAACSTGHCARVSNQSCTQKSVKVFILKAEYVVSQPLELLGFEYPLWADEFPEYLKMFRPVVCEAGVSNKAPPKPPPPLSGRSLCVRHEQFRC